MLKELQNNYDTLLHKFAAAENALGRSIKNCLGAAVCLFSVWKKKSRNKQFSCFFSVCQLGS